MRFSSISLAALSISVALAVCVGGCKEERAGSAYHPNASVWYPSPLDAKHAAQSPQIAPAVPGIANMGESGTTRATASIGGIGGGPTDGTYKGEHRGHLGAGTTTGTVDDAAKAVSRTGK